MEPRPCPAPVHLLEEIACCMWDATQGCPDTVPELQSLEGQEVVGHEALATALAALQRQLEHRAFRAPLLHHVRVQHPHQHLHPLHLQASAHIKRGRTDGQGEVELAQRQPLRSSPELESPGYSDQVAAGSDISRALFMMSDRTDFNESCCPKE